MISWGIGTAFVFRGIRLNMLSKENGIIRRKATTPHKAYEMIFGAFLSSSLISITNRIT
jgi:hypothetical protein